LVGEYWRAKLPETVILDTNFLFIPIRFGVDIIHHIEGLLGPVEIVIPSSIIDELEILKNKVSSDQKREIYFTQKFARKFDILQVNKQKNETVDESIIRIAETVDGIVATTDKDLRKRLRSRGIPVIYLRQESQLEIEGRRL
jgi:hypothetical protein